MNTLDKTNYRDISWFHTPKEVISQYEDFCYKDGARVQARLNSWRCNLLNEEGYVEAISETFSCRETFKENYMETEAELIQKFTVLEKLLGVRLICTGVTCKVLYEREPFIQIRASYVKMDEKILFLTDQK